MGFNKRYIRIESLLYAYQNRGINGVEKLIIKPDALIVSVEDNSKYIVDKIMSGDLNGAELILNYEQNRQDVS